jgi:hypothetical protein
VNTAVNLCVLDQLGDHQLLKEDPVAWSWFLNGNGCAEKRADSRGVFCAAEATVYRMQTVVRQGRFQYATETSQMRAEDETKSVPAVHQGPCHEEFDALDSVEW